MKKAILALGAVLLMTSCGQRAELPETAEPLAKPASQGALSVENSRFILEVDEAGALKVTEKDSGAVFTSAPEAAGEDPVAAGINMSRLNSEFYVTLIKSDGSTAELNSFDASESKDGVSVERIGDTVKVSYLYPDQNVMHSVEYALDGEGFSAAVKFSELNEQFGKISGDDWGFYTVGVLPWFGAAGPESTGYTVVPDGSGAIINHNNNKSSYAAYAQEIYGRDPSLNLETKTLETKTAPFPVYGSVGEGRAFAAIIDGDAAEATVYAETGGTNTSYNNVYAAFNIRRSDSVTRTVSNGYGGDSTLGRTAVSANVPEDGEIRIEYKLFSGENLSYVDLANAYRDYLTDGGLEASDAGAPLYLSMTGGISDTAYTLGIPHRTVVPVTDFDAAGEIIADLEDNGVENIAVRYRGWQKGGEDTKVPKNTKAEGRLGGSGDFRRLLNSGAKVFPELELVHFYRGGNGLNLQSDCVKALSGSAAYVYEYAVNTGARDTEEEPSRLLNPAKAAEVWERFGKNGFENVSLGSVGETLPSEFNGDAPLTRAETAEIYGGLSGAPGHTMVSGGNSYTLPWADYIYSMESEATGYDLEDGSIPFYQIALHGLRSYSVPPINLTADTNRAMLKALETGSSLCYSVSAGDVSVTGDAAPYAYIRDTVLGQASAALPVLEAVGGDRIVSHEKLGDGLYRTGFSSGAAIYVNYGSATAIADGREIAGESFLFEEGR